MALPAVSESLFSSSWYRVAEIRPRLRSHALIHRHLYRGQVWYVLQDRSTGRFHRFSPEANFLIGLMNGRRTLREIWEIACTRLGDDLPTQDEVINIVASLHRADVLQANAPPDLQELHQRTVQQDRMRIKQYIQNPLALRFPLFDPNRLLDWLNPFTRRLFTWAGAFLWLGVVGWALALAGVHWTELTENVTDRVLAFDNLLLMGIVFPIAKAIHELGHGLAVKAKGGEVHEAGVMVLVLMPLPYVDATASLAFRNKGERMLVGAAGMLTELFIAALAIFVWVSVEPGLVRALAFNVIVVAGVSTLVFNANPLLRFDGYYIASDYLEIPNLGQRANAYLGYLLKRHVFGMERAPAPQTAPGEPAWFVVYAIASFCYRMFVMSSIVLVLAEQYFVIGVLLALWALYTMLVQPIAKQVAYLFAASELREKRSRAIATTALSIAFVAALLLWMPAPSWTRTEGVAVAPQNAQVRAGTDAFIKAVVARPNHRVKAGQLLLVTEDPELGAKVHFYEAQLREQYARYTAARSDRVQVKIIQEEILHIQSRLDDARRRLGELEIRSATDGVFLMAQSADAPGRFVHRGELLAYVMDFSKVAVQVVVPQGDVDLVREMTRRVDMRRVDRMSEIVRARVKRVVPAATNQLPNLALSAQGGGEISLDPQAGSDGRAASNLFIFELELAAAGRPSTLGSRVYARFERHPEPLATQWYRSVRGVLLKRFNV
jgi:putative peptide zinc metalloprotease protein